MKCFFFSNRSEIYKGTGKQGSGNGKLVKNGIPRKTESYADPYRKVFRKIVEEKGDLFFLDHLLINITHKKNSRIWTKNLSNESFFAFITADSLRNWFICRFLLISSMLEMLMDCLPTLIMCFPSRQFTKKIDGKVLSYTAPVSFAHIKASSSFFKWQALVKLRKKSYFLSEKITR